MEVVQPISENDCCSFLFRVPQDVIETLLPPIEFDGFFKFDEELMQKEARMVDVAKKRSAIRSENSYLDNIFAELHYRFLEQKNAHIQNLRSLVGTVSDQTLDVILYQICLDKINSVRINTFFKKNKLGFFLFL
jgi:hypothetical protein